MIARSTRILLACVLIFGPVGGWGCGASAGAGPADGGLAPADVVDSGVPADVPTADAPADAPGAPDAAGEAPLPVNLALYARLRAVGTRGFAGLPWPREASDALATVRDGHADTGWKPLVGAPSVAEVDLLPFAGRAVALASVALRLEGGTATDVTVALAPGCGLEPDVSLVWDEPEAPLDLDGRSAGCVTITLTGSADLVVGELWLENADAALNPLFTPADPPPEGPRDLASGAIEGFYGVPWSWSERRAMVRHIARIGLGAYLYAPKNDPLHRDRWREPYDDDFLAAFSSLADDARAAGVVVLFGVSPFIDYDFDDPADYETLRTKALRFLDAGAGGVALLADDIEFELDRPVDAALGAWHADVANRLLADLDQGRSALVFWFVPTAYSDDRADGWPGGWAYLEAVAQLDPRIRILWTGRDTFNATMAGGEIDRFRQATGRRPLIWDNFWANDGGDGFFGRVVLTPFRGRTPDLPDAVVGIAHNLSIQGSLSRLALTTFAAWKDDPTGYDPDQALARAGAEEALLARGAAAAADRDAGIVRLVMSLFDAYGADVPSSPAHEAAIRALRDRLAAAPEEIPVGDAAAALLSCARLATLPDVVHDSGLAVDVVDDLVWPLDKLREEGDAGLSTIALLGQRLAGSPGDDEEGAADAALKRGARSRFAWGTDAVGRLLTDVRGVPIVDRGFWAIPVAPGEPPFCRAGAALDWAPFDGAEDLHVFGLPGGRVDGDRILWTPPHAGAYDAVAVALRTTGSSGWGVRRVSFRCLP